MLTYRQLLEALDKLPKDRLDDTVTIVVSEDEEYFGAKELAFVSEEENNVLDDGHLIIVI